MLLQLFRLQCSSELRVTICDGLLQLHGGLRVDEREHCRPHMESASSRPASPYASSSTCGPMESTVFEASSIEDLLKLVARRHQEELRILRSELEAQSDRLRQGGAQSIHFDTTGENRQPDFEVQASSYTGKQDADGNNYMSEAAADNAVQASPTEFLMDFPADLSVEGEHDRCNRRQYTRAESSQVVSVSEASLDGAASVRPRVGLRVRHKYTEQEAEVIKLLPDLPDYFLVRFDTVGPNEGTIGSTTSSSLDQVRKIAQFEAWDGEIAMPLKVKGLANESSHVGSFCELKKQEISSALSRKSTRGRLLEHVKVQFSLSSFDTVKRKREARYRVVRWLRKIVDSKRFESLCVAAILLNVIILGLSTDAEAKQSKFPLLDWIDGVLSVWFVLEVVMRMAAEGCILFWCGENALWHIFDFVVVVTDLIDKYALHIMQGEGGTSTKSFRIIRTLRIVRAVRAIRLVRFFKELRTMVFSVLRSGLSLFWSAVLLFMTIYSFSIYLMDTVTPHLAISEYKEGVTDKLEVQFGSLVYSCYTLFQSIAGGVSWIEVAKPLEDVHWTNVVVFVFFIFFTDLALLNIITGVFVETALSSTQVDREELIQETLMSEDSILLNLHFIFNEADANRTGVLTFEELQEQLEKPQVRAYLKHFDIEVSDANGFFQMLDSKKSGVITVEDFLMGCLKIKGGAKAIDLQMMMQELRWFKAEMLDFQDHVRHALRSQKSFQESMMGSTSRSSFRINTVKSLASVSAGSGSPRTVIRNAYAKTDSTDSTARKVSFSPCSFSM